MSSDGSDHAAAPETIRADRARRVRRLLTYGAWFAALGTGLYFATWFCLLPGWITVFSDAPNDIRFPLAIFMAIVTVKIVVALAYWVWLMAVLLFEAAFPPRLELDDDAVRLVRGGLLGPVVLTEIPYANVAAVRVATGKHRVAPLAVMLHDPVDPDTYIGSEKSRRRVALGLPYLFPAGWQVDVKTLAERLRRRCRQLTDEQPPPREDHRIQARPYVSLPDPPSIQYNGPYRDGTQLVLYASVDMPPRCPICNRDAVAAPIALEFSAKRPEGGITEAVFDGIEYLRGWRYTGPVMVLVSFCPVHRSRRYYKTLIGAALLAGAVLYLVVDNWGTTSNLAANKPPAVGTVIACVLAVTGAFIAGTALSEPDTVWFEPTRFHERTVWVTGAGPAFLATLPEYRAEER